ncbi:hypothetical protein PHJA_002155900 [Phtheirospermum japonicum]|uniref:Uncharacterized protein n=1 Tax=Phtheirospermum japonicum TaxID=374723 RepID=A0A830CRB1_9LAMI|nr:hypothetical protein PHJA_002155900 [Phtheirospermum japonicum]
MMFGFSRMKRVTDPLDDKAKARIVGRSRIGPDHVSSGSEYSADRADDDVTTSASLSELFLRFLTPPSLRRRPATRIAIEIRQCVTRAVRLLTPSI